MFRSNIIEFEIKGRSAMFTDPEARRDGRLTSLTVPTYEAVKGVLHSIYWKPTILWVPDEIRVMNEIRTSPYPMKLRRGAGFELISAQRLINVRYQVRAHFIWNENRPEFTADRDEDKHFHIALRSLSRGGRRCVYLGRADCPAEVRSQYFGSGSGFYDGTGCIDLGEMYHGTTYPDEGWDEATRRGIYVRSWHCVMQDGVIRFVPPENCSSVFLRAAVKKSFVEDQVSGGGENARAGAKNRFPGADIRQGS